MSKAGHGKLQLVILHEKWKVKNILWKTDFDFIKQNVLAASAAWLQS